MYFVSFKLLLVKVNFMLSTYEYIRIRFLYY